MTGAGSFKPAPHSSSPNFTELIDNRPQFHYFQGALLLFKKYHAFFRKPSIWGRNGFDGDKEALVAYRVLIGS
jgi:hypothetical protein